MELRTVVTCITIALSIKTEVGCTGFGDNGLGGVGIGVPDTCSLCSLSDYIAHMLRLYCPHSHATEEFDRRGIVMDDTCKSAKSMCPHSVCLCDAECDRNDDCCPECNFGFSAYGTSCMNTWVKQSFSVGSEDGVVAVTSCPVGNNNTIIRKKCEEEYNPRNFTLIDSTPVSVGSLFFRNKYCALCHSIEPDRYSVWNSVIVCHKPPKLPSGNTFTLDIVNGAMLSNDCDIMFVNANDRSLQEDEHKAPEEGNMEAGQIEITPVNDLHTDSPHLRRRNSGAGSTKSGKGGKNSNRRVRRDVLTEKNSKCDPGKQLISSCNETGLWRNYDKRTEDACALISSEFMNNYRNLFCYICNAADEYIDEKDCTGLFRSNVSRTTTEENPFGFSWTYFMETETMNKEAEELPPHENNRDGIEEVRCATGKVLMNDCCESIFKPPQNAIYDITVVYEPGNFKMNSANMDANLLNELDMSRNLRFGFHPSEQTVKMIKSMTPTGTRLRALILHVKLKNVAQTDEDIDDVEMNLQEEVNRPLRINDAPSDLTFVPNPLWRAKYLKAKRWFEADTLESTHAVKNEGDMVPNADQLIILDIFRICPYILVSESEAVYENSSFSLQFEHENRSITADKFVFDEESRSYKVCIDDYSEESSSCKNLHSDVKADSNRTESTTLPTSGTHQHEVRFPTVAFMIVITIFCAADIRPLLGRCCYVQYS